MVDPSRPDPSRPDPAPDRPGLPIALPAPRALAIGAAAALLLVVVTAWIATGSSSRALREAREDAATADARASELSRSLADLRGDLQQRQGRIEDLEDRATELASELEGARDTAGTPAASPGPSDPAEDDPEGPATADSVEAVTTAIATTEDATLAVHVTEVIDGRTLVGFDLGEMLADGPAAGAPVTIRLAGIDTPDEGDCRHTQSVGLATAWVDAADGDVLLRRPPGAPATDAQGRLVAEVLAFGNPRSSLPVTLTVAGEAIIDEATVEEDPDLTERLRVAQTSAQAGGSGVWSCPDSRLLAEHTSPATATPTPSPDDGTGTPAATPATTPASPQPTDG